MNEFYENDNLDDLNVSHLTKKKIEYKKELSFYQKNEREYDKTKAQLINDAKEILGDDIFENYFLPNDFNLEKLSGEYFRNTDVQELPLPFKNETIEHLVSIPKKPINDIYIFNTDVKTIHSIYLLGNDNGKPVLFALSIIKDKDKSDNLDFNIKLDVCIQGRTWMPLARLDSLGPAHPNFIVDGKVVKDVEDIEEADTPHIHLNSEECQVLDKDNLRYTTAKSLDATFMKDKTSKDKLLFKKCFDAFMKFSNAEIEINKNISKDYKYSFSELLFDYDKIKQIKYPNGMER